MTKAKTNALDALRTLIAERQQYEQWVSSLGSKREGTAEHVYDRVMADYQSRLERVVRDIRGHAEELQLSISTLSSRLVEVARDEDTRREGLQEAELRAAVGEYQPAQWDQLRSESENALERIAADRSSLDGQLSELRAIQKLSEAGSTGAVPIGVTANEVNEPTPVEQKPALAEQKHTPATELSPAQSPVSQVPLAASAQEHVEPRSDATPKPSQDRAFEPVGAAAGVGTATAAPASATASSSGSMSASRGRSAKTPPGGVSAVRSRMEGAKPDNSKTLKCPECGTPNYPTEWYCERCGGELATM